MKMKYQSNSTQWYVVSIASRLDVCFQLRVSQQFLKEINQKMSQPIYLEANAYIFFCTRNNIYINW